MCFRQSESFVTPFSSFLRLKWDWLAGTGSNAQWLCFSVVNYNGDAIGLDIFTCPSNRHFCSIWFFVPLILAAAKNNVGFQTFVKAPPNLPTVSFQHELRISIWQSRAEFKMSSFIGKIRNLVDELLLWSFKFGKGKVFQSHHNWSKLIRNTSTGKITLSPKYVQKMTNEHIFSHQSWLT